MVSLGSIRFCRDFSAFMNWLVYRFSVFCKVLWGFKGLVRVGFLWVLPFPQGFLTLLEKVSPGSTRLFYGFKGLD